MCPPGKVMAASSSGGFPSEKVANPNRFSESEPLLRTRIGPTRTGNYENRAEEWRGSTTTPKPGFNEEFGNTWVEGSDINKKTCGLRVEGPDGVRAWCVAFSAFFISFIIAGIGRVGGILLPRFLEDYSIDRKMGSVPCSVQLALRFILGPFVGILGHGIGVRKITFLGILIAAGGTAACNWTSHFTWVIIWYGGFAGIGVALSTSLLQLTIGKYFIKNKATAMGMSLAGGCLGSIALPPIEEILLQMLPLHSVFLYMAGIICIALPFSLAFKDPPWMNAKKLSSENCAFFGTSRAKDPLENSFLDKQDYSASKNVMFPRNMPNITFLRQHKELIIKLLRKATILDSQMSEKDKLCLETSIRISMEDLFQYMNNVLRNFTEKIFTKSESHEKSLKPISVSNETNLAPGEHSGGSLNGIAENFSDGTKLPIVKKLEEVGLMSLSEMMGVCPNENKHVIFNISIELRKLCSAAVQLEKQENGYLLLCGPEKDEQIQKENSSHFYCNCHHMILLVKSSCKPVFLLYKNPKFLFISICRLGHFISFVPVVVVLGDFLMEKGLPKSDGQYGVISLSVGDLIGRLLMGWVTDKGYLSMSNFMAIIMFFQFVINIILPFTYKRCMIFIALCIFGLLNGSNFVRHPVLISTYMEDHEQPFAMGCLSFFSGIFASVMPFYVGLCKDIIGTYNVMFYISAGIGASLSLIWYSLPNLEAFYSARETTNESDEPV